MSGFVDMAMELLNIKNHVTIDELKESFDNKHLKILDDINRLNKSINNCHNRIDMQENEIDRLEELKQLKIDELEELFYKEI